MGVQVFGAHEVAAKFRQAAANVKAMQPQMLLEAAEITKKEVGLEIARNGLVESGKLLRSVRHFGLFSGSVNVGVGKGLKAASDGSNYAWWLELGTSPHPIPGNPLLSFYWEREGVQFVGPLVQRHPGNRAYRFARRGGQSAFFPIALMLKERLFKALMIV